MATISETRSAAFSSGTPTAQVTPALIGVIVWQIALAVLCVFGAIQLFQVEEFFNLGTFVPRFVGIVALGVAGTALFSAVQIARLKNGGRLIGIFIHFFGFGLMILLTLHLLGLFVAIDGLAQGAFFNAWILLGFPIGYAVVRLGRRFDSETVQKIGLGLMMITLIALLAASIFSESQLHHASGVLTGQFNFDLTIGAFLRALLRLEVLVTVGALAAFFASGVVLIRNGERFGETLMQREAWQGWLFLLPNFVNFMLFFAMPLILSFYLSFTDYDAVSPANWVLVSAPT